MQRRLPLFLILMSGLFALACAVAAAGSPAPIERLRAGSGALFGGGAFAALLIERLQWRPPAPVTTFPEGGASFRAERGGRTVAWALAASWFGAGILGAIASNGSLWSVLLASASFVTLIALLLPRPTGPLLLIDRHGIHDRRVFSAPLLWSDIKDIRYRAEWFLPWLAVFLVSPDAHKAKRRRQWLFPPKLAPMRLNSTHGNLAEIEAALRQFAPPHVFASFENWRDDDWQPAERAG